jgi:hypothetical protein
MFMTGKTYPAGYPASHPAKRPPRSPAVQFGWFSPGHHAIDKGAIFRLKEDTPKERSWKAYLISHWRNIEAGNDMQDILYDGPNHYISLPDRGNIPPTLPNGDPDPNAGKPKRYSLEEMAELMSPEMLSAWETAWRQFPLEPNTMLPTDSLYNAVLESYALVKKQLVQIAQGNKKLDLVVKDEQQQAQETREVFYEELSKNIGRLTHYAADMFIPFHVNNGVADWEVWPGEPNIGMHLFSEGDVLTKSDYTGLVEEAKQRLEDPNQTPLPELTETTLPQFILAKMQASFRKLFEIAAVHRQTVADPSVNQSKNTGLRALKDRVRPILAQQIREAQEAIGGMLQAVWKEAGEPVIRDPEAAAD